MLVFAFAAGATALGRARRFRATLLQAGFEPWPGEDDVWARMTGHALRLVDAPPDDLGTLLFPVGVVAALALMAWRWRRTRGVLAIFAVSGVLLGVLATLDGVGDGRLPAGRRFDADADGYDLGNRQAGRLCDLERFSVRRRDGGHSGPSFRVVAHPAGRDPFDVQAFGGESAALALQAELARLRGVLGCPRDGAGRAGSP